MTFYESEIGTGLRESGDTPHLSPPPTKIHRRSPPLPIVGKDALGVGLTSD